MEAQKKINELHEENKEIARRNIRGSIADEVSEEMQKENLMKIKDLEDTLLDYSRADRLIDEEVVELSRFLTDSQKLFQNTDMLEKFMLLKIFLVELSIDNKKQLTFEENKLFELIRGINFLIWQVH